MYELLDLPMPSDGLSNDELYSCVAKLLELHGENHDVKTRLDMILYHLYNLTYDEVLIVDQNPPFTREQYEPGNYNE